MPCRQQTYLTTILAFHSVVNLGNFFIWILQKLKTKKIPSPPRVHTVQPKDKNTGEKGGKSLLGSERHSTKGNLSLN